MFSIRGLVIGRRPNIKPRNPACVSYDPTRTLCTPSNVINLSLSLFPFIYLYSTYSIANNSSKERGDQSASPESAPQHGRLSPRGKITGASQKYTSVINKIVQEWLDSEAPCPPPPPTGRRRPRPPPPPRGPRVINAPGSGFPSRSCLFFFFLPCTQQPATATATTVSLPLPPDPTHIVHTNTHFSVTSSRFTPGCG